MQLKNVIKINQTQKDSAADTGVIGSHTLNPENVYVENQGSWSTWTTITGSNTLGLKDNAYYHFQVRNTSNTTTRDFGIVRMSSNRNFIIAGYSFGGTPTRLTFYRVSAGYYATYIYQQTGSSFSSLTPSSGTLQVRYRRVNL